MNEQKPAKRKNRSQLVISKQKATRLRPVKIEVVPNDPIHAVHRVVHTVGEAAKAVTNLVEVMKPHLDRMRKR